MIICFIHNVSVGGFCFVVLRRNPLGNPDKLGDFTGEFLDVGAIIGDSYSTEGMRTPDINRLHAKNMAVTL